MIDPATLSLYLVAVLALAITPGPTMLLALSNAVAGGRRAACAGIAGATLASGMLIVAVAFGLGAVLAASTTLFEMLRVAGVLYLCWLGVKLWRAKSLGLADRLDASAPAMRPQAAFLRSLTVALSNPKALLFFTAFLPQFIDPTRVLTGQYLVLGATFLALDACVMLMYASAGMRAVRLLSARGLKMVNRACALAMFALAALLAAFRRSGA
jgi:homoserine/homoserine lactone efflux protein